MLPFQAVARELDVRVADARGAPVPDAVVTAVPRANYTSLPAVPSPKTHIIDQKNETFIPYIEVFRPGDSVVFHNSDHTRHHVYSFAPARQFEFVLAPGESSTPLPLTQSGVIAVGCNIHDQMITYFYVTEAPFVARSDGDGRARIDLPPGSFDVRVWHPRQRPGSPDNAQAFTAAADAAPAGLAYTLTLLPDQRDAHDPERSGY
ncbi:MAG TPA: methylamine utilization protein [Rudaea sp.]